MVGFYNRNIFVVKIVIGMGWLGWDIVMEFGKSIKEWGIVMLEAIIVGYCCYRDRGLVKCIVEQWNQRKDMRWW